LIQLLPQVLDPELDWTAYMQQVSQYVDGEKDYTKLYGGTGPLVYPAAHVYTYRLLYWVTNKGQDILMAQGIFAVLYLVTLAVVMRVYRNAKVSFQNCSCFGQQGGKFDWERCANIWISDRSRLMSFLCSFSLNASTASLSFVFSTTALLSCRSGLLSTSTKSARLRWALWHIVGVWARRCRYYSPCRHLELYCS